MPCHDIMHAPCIYTTVYIWSWPCMVIWPWTAWSRDQDSVGRLCTLNSSRSIKKIFSIVYFNRHQREEAFRQGRHGTAIFGMSDNSLETYGVVHTWFVTVLCLKHWFWFRLEYIHGYPRTFHVLVKLVFQNPYKKQAALLNFGLFGFRLGYDLIS